jgi:hypothetical protein
MYVIVKKQKKHIKFDEELLIYIYIRLTKKYGYTYGSTIVFFSPGRPERFCGAAL